MNQQNYSGLITIITVILLGCTGVAAWFGFSLLDRHQQTEQIDLANDFLEQKQYGSAIEVYDRLLADDNIPNHPLWINRGYAFLGLNQYQDMLESCSEATSIKPQSALAWNCRGEALYYLQQPEKALEAFEQATSNHPQSATFWLNKAMVLEDLQQYQEAIAANQQALKLIKQSESDNRAMAFARIGQSLLQLQQYQAALEAFSSSLAIADYLPAQQGTGIALYELGDYQQAIAMFDQVLQQDSLNSEQKVTALLYRGVSMCQLQKPIEAKESFQEVLELTNDPKSQEIAVKGCGIG